MSMSQCGKICITPAKCIRKEKVHDFFLSLLYCCCHRRHVLAVFRCESESTLFGLPKEDTTRNAWLSCIYNTFQNSSTQIFECVQHILQRTISWTWESSLQCQLCTKSVSIKWGNPNFARTVWRFIFKEFATDHSNASFEQCSVVLVVCRKKTV